MVSLKAPLKKIKSTNLSQFFKKLSRKLITFYFRYRIFKCIYFSLEFPFFGALIGWGVGGFAAAFMKTEE